MNKMEFYRNRKKSVNIILICLGLFIVFVGLFLYSIGLVDSIVSPKLAAMSGIFGAILGIISINRLLALRDTSPLLILDNNGITAKVTAMSNAAGLIRWEDIIDVSINKVGGDTLITLTIDKPDHYIPIIRKKLSKLAVDGAQDAQGNLEVYLTASALDLEAPELFTVITAFREGISNQVNVKHDL